jgi:hypothetical protein
MKELVSVLIPIVDPELSEFEKELLDHCVMALGKYSLLFVASEKADLGYLKERYEQIDTICFNERYFQSDRSIDLLLLMDGFYERFNWCEFVLIHRLNSWIVKDELHYWCKQGYDFMSADLIGSRTFVQELYRVFGGLQESTIGQWDEVMCGSGVSLRHVDQCVRTLQRKRRVAYKYRHHPKLAHTDALFWDLETNRFFPDLRKPTSIVRNRFSTVVGRLDQHEISNREQFSFAITGLTSQNRMKLPFFD